ncbi:MAG: hypothetical protein KAY27_01525 [Pedobacter sp.]|nr:hypothetical protein [Pedobacter sp.]
MDFKKVITSIILLFSAASFSTELFSQAKKPTIMVVPSRQWCFIKGYYTMYDNFGTQEKMPDYQKAFDENPDLLLVVSKINSLYTDRGFELKDVNQTLSSINRGSAEDAAMNLDRQGSGKGIIAESMFDRVRNTAKADILIEIQWTINGAGPSKSVTYIMRGLDAYSDKQIAGSEGTGEASISSPLPVVLAEAVLKHIDNFNARLQAHFEDMFANGREIKLEFRRDGNWANNFETEFGSDELSFQIEDWLAKNTVKGRFSTEESTADKLVYTQVRIPMFDANQRAIDARAYARNVQKFLKAAPFNIDVKVVAKGLGYVQFICGIK